MKTVLSIAGSDCSGGAGIQADIKTISAHKLYAMSVITALTAQNTTGVFGVLNTEPSFVEKQIDAVFTDIFPDAVKIGMVSSADIILTIAAGLKKYNPQWIVLDPVMISTSGSKLLNDDAALALVNDLLPLASIITPNLAEAEVLANLKIHSENDMVKSAQIISKNYSGAILIKGGHLTKTANDLLYHNGAVNWILGERIANPNTHGTGCTLSSAIACELAMGNELAIAVSNAKKYVAAALCCGLDLGHGSGPLQHQI